MLGIGDRAPCCVLVAVRGAIDELGLALLEPLALPLAGLRERARRLVNGFAVIVASAAADRCRFGGRELGLVTS
jgi:hypothetical protein